MSNTKGGRFENNIAKKLSSWLTNDISKTELIRSKQSGGWSEKDHRQVGDLAPNGPIGERFRSIFGLELKAREVFQWRQYFTSDKPELMEWWDKLVTECDEYDLIPLLVYKKNFVPTLIGSYSDVLFGDSIERIFSLKDYNGNYVKFITLDDFMDTYNPENFMRYHEGDR